MLSFPYDCVLLNGMSYCDATADNVKQSISQSAIYLPAKRHRCEVQTVSGSAARATVANRSIAKFSSFQTTHKFIAGSI
jgi:hypothetical protein